MELFSLVLKRPVLRAACQIVLAILLSSHVFVGVSGAAVHLQNDARLAEAQQLEDKGLRLIGEHRFLDAVEAFKGALSIRQSIFIQPEGNVSRSWHAIGYTYGLIAYWRDSAIAYENAMAIMEKIPTADRQVVGNTMYELGAIYMDGNDFVHAEQRLTRALDILTRVPNVPIGNVERVRFRLARLAGIRRDFVQAEKLLTTSIQNDEVAFGKDCPQQIAPLLELRRLHNKQGNFDKGEATTRRAAAILEKARGSIGTPTWESLTMWSEHFEESGQDEESEAHAQRALEMLARVTSPFVEQEVQLLHRLGKFSARKGNFAEADQYALRAVEIVESSNSRNERLLANCLIDLANYYNRYKRYPDQIEPILLRALGLHLADSGPDSNGTLSARKHLAGHYFNVGNTSKAAEMFRSSLQIVERQGHPDSLTMAETLDEALFFDGEPGIDAVTLLRRSIGIKERQVGEHHPYVAVTRRRLADVLVESDRPTAETYLAKSIDDLAAAGFGFEASLTESRIALARFKLFDREYAECGRLLDEAAGGYALSTTEEGRQLTLASVAFAKGDYVSAVSIRREALKQSEENFASFLVSGTEQEKLSVVERLAGDIPFVLEIVDSVPTNVDAVRLACETVLLRKGRVLDTLIASRSARPGSNSPDIQDLRSRLIAARERLAVLISRPRGIAPTSSSDDAARKVREEMAAISAELTNLGAVGRIGAGGTSIKQIQEAIPADSALVEYISYALPGERFRTWRSAKYAAIVLRRTRDPVWIDLGERAPIDDVIKSFQKVLRSPGSSPDAEVKPAAQVLYNRTFAAVRARLGDATNILVAPDGALSLVPFGALVDEVGQYVVQSLSITYVSSGRDLVRPQASKPAFANPVVVANPDFGAPTARASNVAGLAFSALPGTADEGARVGKLLGSSPLTGSQATEAALKRVNGPSILHVATHGFFVSGSSTGPELTRGIVKIGEPAEAVAGSGLLPASNPLDASLRAGIALAGANNGISGADDGILTAIEAAELNLTGTQLVVLSACETGVGEVLDGEGVFGLRRAFAIAGAESQMLSLWKVDDAGTRDLMVGFYTRLTSGAGRGDALRQTQLAMLADPALAHPYYWASFILAGDSGPVVLKRRPLIM